MNSGLVYLADQLLGLTGGDVALGNAVFFMFLLSLLTTLHDHYQPVHAYRARHEAPAKSGSRADQS